MISTDSKLRRVLQNPRKAARYIGKRGSRNAMLTLSLLHRPGTNPLSRDWDVLILLDTCRVDALRAVKDEYEMFDGTEIDRIWSVGGASAEWMAATFDRKYADILEKTAYIASNGHAKIVIEDQLEPEEDDKYGPDIRRMHRFDSWDVVSPDEIGRLEHVWKYEPSGESGALGHEQGHSPPRYVTDRAISVGRENDFDRLILHYNQPHSPYVANAIAENRELTEYERNPMEYIKRTDDRETVFQSYLDELRYVLDDIELLLQNLDADRVAISADHGEAFGEWGVYGHHAGSIHPKIRYVPWVIVSGTDTNSYTSEFDPITASERSVENILGALGYM